MFNYKKILVVVFDINKSNKALKEVQQILADNACEHEVFTEDKDPFNRFCLAKISMADGCPFSKTRAVNSARISFSVFISVPKDGLKRLIEKG